MLTVTVRVRSGEYATGLNREAFQILDEKDVRPIEFFESGEDSSSVAILIDTSASMQLLESKDVARPAAIGEALSEAFQADVSGNEYFLAAFDRSLRFLTDWKSSQALLADKTPIGQEGQNTAMYDACFAAIEKLATGHHARMLELNLRRFAGVGLGLEAPVVDRVEHGLGVADGNVDPRIAVRRAGFQQEHRTAPVGGQAVRQHAAGGSGADDDVIPGSVGHRLGGRQRREGAWEPRSGIRDPGERGGGNRDP